MQKSKKMMVSVCGLALSSLFVLNNKSVVHADVANTNQNNNAITWDSDQDDSQVVTQQTNVSHTKTEQSMPQKADNNQQNVQSVNANHAEIATVSSSSEITNRTNTIDAQNASVQAKQKVANVQDAQAVNPVVIKNPAGNKIHVNWVNSKGETIPNVNGYDIDLTKVGTQSEYHWIPDGYHLLKSGRYTISSHPATATYIVKSDANLDDVQKNNRYYNTKAYLDKYGSIAKKIGIESNTRVSWGWGTPTGGYHAGPALRPYTYSLPHMYINDTRYIEDNENWVKDTTDYDFTNPWTSDPSPSTAPIGDQEASFLKGLWNAIKKDVNATYDAEGAVTESDGYNGKGGDGAFKIDRYYESPASTVFIDNSGAVLKQSGNTINVALIKPQHVDPASDARMRATATRTIQINFPGTIPPSYKNIVNDKGVLIQTVTFTRTGQEDALTGDLINSTLTPWKSNNQDPDFIGFPERTLPRIPGYTLSIKPA